MFASLLPLVFGATMTISFAPANAWWFTPCALAGLFVVSEGATRWQAGLRGLLFGFGWFGVGFWWTFPGLHSHTGAGVWLSLMLTAALVMSQSVFPALAMCMLRHLVPTSHGLHSAAVRWIATAALWMLAEWSRGNLFGGLPMLATGYAHAIGPLAAFAPMVGVYGIGFLNAAIAAMLADCVGDPVQDTRVRPAAVLGIVTLVLASLALDSVSWTRDSGRTLSVRLVQTNIAGYAKHTVSSVRRDLSIYTDMAASSPAELTVFPESALPVVWNALPPALLEEWKNLARQRQGAILLGAMVAGTGRTITNSALAIIHGLGPGNYDYRYDKIHLVPLGEQIPVRGRWLFDRMNLGLEPITPGGQTQGPLTLPKAKVAVSICFEDLFDTSTAAKAREAQLLLNLSNFSWFDGTYAAAQHLQAAQLRAREVGRWVLQAANTGLTAVIDENGVIRQVLPPEVLGTLDANVRLFEGTTPFMLLGNAPLLDVSSLLLVYLVLRRQQRGHS
jgi:apolipoprotein N-acyltransferase